MLITNPGRIAINGPQQTLPLIRRIEECIEPNAEELM